MTEGVTKAPNSISQRSVDLCWICQVQWSLPTAEAVSLHMLGVLCLQNKKAARIGKTSYMASSNPRPPSCCFTIQLCENWARQIEDPVCVCVCVCVCARGQSLNRVHLFATPCYSSPGSSVPEILQAGILEWTAIFPNQGSIPHLLCLLHCRWILYHWVVGKAWAL